MAKRILSRTFRVGTAVGKGTVFSVGLIVIVGFAALTVSNVASGKVPSLKKGVINNVKAVTTLVGNLTDPILRLDNNGQGTALDLQVEGGVAPMTVNSLTRVDNLNADLVDGASANDFLQANDVYKSESAVGPGTALGDGTFTLEHACDPGDVLLSGGPANVAPTSTMVESFPAPGSETAWKVRINKNAQNDSFSVVLLCVNQQ